MERELRVLLEGAAVCADQPPLVRDALGDPDVERAARIVQTLLRPWDDAGLVAPSPMLPVLE